MKVGEFMQAMETDGCLEVAGPRYCLNLYALAESVQARRILEVGLGWGYSGRTFCASMSQREPSALTSIDPEPPRKEWSYNDACIWRKVQDYAESYTFDGMVDLLYIDGDPKLVRTFFDRLCKHVVPGGLIVIDGYGHNDSHTMKAVNELSVTHPFMLFPYSKDWAHAVHRKAA